MKCDQPGCNKKPLLEEPFKTSFAQNIYYAKYANSPGMTWKEKANTLAWEVAGGLLTDDEVSELAYYIFTMKFIPGGRYIYYAGRIMNAYNNCFCLKGEEDTREEWARLTHDAMSCLMLGGGIGIDYSVFRPEGEILSRTGGVASGPIPLMKVMNEVGRHVMQGGSRRSAMYASLNWHHRDCADFIHAKDWTDRLKLMKEEDFNFPAPLDMTNISVNYDDEWYDAITREDCYDGGSEEDAQFIFNSNIMQMLRTAEPGMSFNFGKHGKETLRNACAEFISDTDSDVCNLGSVNFGNIDSFSELTRISFLASKFLVCGGYRADLPYEKVYETRKKNRSIGLGLMGLHEWLLKRGYKYEVCDELESWLWAWSCSNERGANLISDELRINWPRRYRAVAPTGTIGILASTTTGIEPLFAVAYKRRYLTDGDQWNYEYVVDATAERLIREHGINPDEIETAYSLAQDPERRIKFQYDVQEYVDMGISSTINLPRFEDQTFTPEDFKAIVLKYCRGLRGLTVYPDGARGGQPLTEVPYAEAKASEGMVFLETEEKCSGGICGL